MTTYVFWAEDSDHVALLVKEADLISDDLESWAATNAPSATMATDKATDKIVWHKDAGAMTLSLGQDHLAE